MRTIALHPPAVTLTPRRQLALLAALLVAVALALAAGVVYRRDRAAADAARVDALAREQVCRRVLRQWACGPDDSGVVVVSHSITGDWAHVVVRTDRPRAGRYRITFAKQSAGWYGSPLWVEDISHGDG